MSDDLMQRAEAWLCGTDCKCLRCVSIRDLLARLQQAEQDLVALKSAITVKNSTNPAWQLKDYCSLATAHREDSENVDEHGTPNNYDTTYDYEVASLDRQARIEQAEAEVARLRAVTAGLEAACSRYCEWYANGIGTDAGHMAYDLVSTIREAIQTLAGDGAPTR